MNETGSIGRLGMRRAASGALAGLLALLLAGEALADRVITEDGRVVQLKKARKEGEGYRLIFEHGEILVPDGARIRAVEIEGDMSDYVPQNDDERDKLAQGYVRYRDRWMTKARYETELRKEYEAARARADLIARHSSWHDAWQKETRNFVIKSNTSPELLDYYGELLETFYRLMDKQIGINPTPTYRRKKMTVNIYKSMEEFHSFNAAGAGGGVLGYFWTFDDSLNFFHDFAEPDLSTWVALHECTHLITFLIDQQYAPQIWLNEAVADYFGAADVTVDARGKIDISWGKLQTDRVLTVQQAIRDEKDTKLAQLFFIDRGQFSGFQYAHAWSFVYFLNEFDKGKYAKGFWRFFKDLYTRAKGIPYEVDPESDYRPATQWRATPATIRDQLLAKIGVRDLDLLEKQWKSFVAEIPIESVEARLKRGIQSIRMLRFDELDAAVEDLTAAIEGGTSDPRAWAYRARARALKSGPKAGVDDLRQAIELDPLDASFRYELSRMLSGHALSSTGRGGFEIVVRGGGDKKPDDPEAKREAGLAMELDPTNDRFREWYRSFE